MRSIPLPLFIVLGLLEITYLMFVIVVRPFRSTFTNVRLVIISLLLLAMDTIMCVYLSYKAMSVYLYVCELSLTILLLVVLVLAIVFCIVEHIYAWRH